MKILHSLSSIAIIMIFQVNAAETGPIYQGIATNLNPVENAFVGTMNYIGNVDLTGAVTHVAVTPIKVDLGSAPKTEICWFPHIYRIEVTIGNRIYYGSECDIECSGNSRLTLRWQRSKIDLHYTNSTSAIKDAQTFESALKHLFGLYERCRTPAAQVTSYRVK